MDNVILLQPPLKEASGAWDPQIPFHWQEFGEITNLGGWVFSLGRCLAPLLQEDSLQGRWNLLNSSCGQTWSSCTQSTPQPSLPSCKERSLPTNRSMEVVTLCLEALLSSVQETHKVEAHHQTSNMGHSPPNTLPHLHFTAQKSHCPAGSSS